MYRVVSITPIMFSSIPAFAISDIFKHRVLKTIAFGGVAIGSIKAKEHDSVAGIMRISGLIFKETDKPASIGNTIIAVAVLEVNSVRNVIIRQTIATTIIVG